MVHGAAAITLVPEPKNFDKGLIFVKETDVLLSGDRWTIVINIAVDDYTTPVDNMKLILTFRARASYRLGRHLNTSALPQARTSHTLGQPVSAV